MTGPAPNAVIKVRLLKKKLIVAGLGTERIRRSDGLTVSDFPVWASEIDKRTSPDVSVSELAEIIKKQVPVTFAALVAGIKAGQVTDEKFPTELPNNYLVYYIVAGY